jgi:SAM-dependent methyltransferase
LALATSRLITIESKGQEVVLNKILDLFRFKLRRLGFEVIRYRSRPKWPGDKDRFEYQKQLVQFDIPAGSVVLDIGSGHYPFPLATILADLYTEETPHRAEKLVRDGRPFVVLDVHHLPFADKSIDFVCCSHVLEHAEDPAQACSELIRVAHRGYIETPTFASDMLFSCASTSNHKWHIVAINNNLLFFEYSARQQKGIQSPIWRVLIQSAEDHPLQEAYYNNRDLFNVMFSWENKFIYEVYKLDNMKKL